MAGTILDIFTAVLALSPGAVLAQADAPDAGRLEQIRTCREGILDPQARAEDRRRWVQLLFSYDSPDADALVIELLKTSARPEVQRTVCSEMTSRGRIDTARLRPVFVDPLILLLQGASDELRTAAAKALAEFQDVEIAARLGKIVSNSNVAMPARLAAVQALSVNTHRREVVEQLVSMLDLNVPEVSERVVAALEPIAPPGMASDPAKWREWWSQKKVLGQEAWLAEHVRVYRDRLRRLTGDLAALQTERDREQTATYSRVRDFQREILRGLSPEQREVKLVEWVVDPLPPVKLAALSIVKSRIADEGKRPEGDLLAALLLLLRHDLPAMRRESLQILQNLRDPAVVGEVLDQLARETDPAIRLALLEALGKLADPSAVPALVGELSRQDADLSAVREAANSLGQIAVRSPGNADFVAAAEPLRNRYHEVSPNQLAVRAALLTAMAGVADDSFAKDFTEALASDDPVILQPAVRGLRALQNNSKLDRVRELSSHADPHVRLAAIETISALGSGDADLEALQARLAPSSESNELVRSAAWEGWQSFVAERPVAERVRAAEKLREIPDLEGEYLVELVRTLSASSNHRAELEAVRQRIVQVLTLAGKYSEAAPHLRDLYEGYAARSDPQAWTIGLRWLDTILQTPGQQGLAELITRLCQATQDEALRSKVVDTVRQYVDSPAMLNDPDRSRRLLADLQSINAGSVGDGWTELLAMLDARVKTAAVSGPAG